MYGAWWKMGMDMAMLAVEAQGVIAQRMAMLALGGPRAQAEAQRMVGEKVMAAGEAAMQLATGASNRKVIRGYRRKVRANARRLSKRRCGSPSGGSEPKTEGSRRNPTP